MSVRAGGLRVTTHGVLLGVVIALAGAGLAAPGLIGAEAQRQAITFAATAGIPSMVALGMEAMVNDLLRDVAATTDIADSEHEVLKRVREGRAQFGLVPIPEIARTLPTADERDRSGLSFVMGGHAAAVAHVFVRNDLPHPTLGGLRGRRVALPEPGTAGETLARALLETHGLGDRDVKPAFMRAEEQVRAFEVGFVDAVILVVPVPSPAVSSPAPTKLAATGKSRLLSLDPEAVARLLQRHPGYSLHSIEAGTYPGQTGDVFTVARKNAVVARKDFSPALVYGFVMPSGALVLDVRARDGGFLPQRVREQIHGLPNVDHVQSFLEGKTADGVRVIGVESAGGAVAAAIVQGWGLEAGDGPEAMVVGKTFAQTNKTALGLSIPAMLTPDHFPPIVIGGQCFFIVGIYATGDPQTDDQVLVLLPTAQRLLNQPGRLSAVRVAPAAQAVADQVVRDLRRVLGDGVEVTSLQSARP
jgi:TRAP transporter TAXI family solute receptor